MISRLLKRGQDVETNKLKVTIYNEFLHEQELPEIRAIYPEGIHQCIADFLEKKYSFNTPKSMKDQPASLQEVSSIEVRHIATFEMPEHGLTEEVLQDTDVLIFWSHALQEPFADAVAERVKEYVQKGMGLVALHSAHYSKVLRKLLGTSMTLRWRDNDTERIVVTTPGHPIAQGIPERFDLAREEMYGEYFDIPKPDDVVFTGCFGSGEVFRSGCTFTRGHGRIFYFQPGHESFPTYYNPIIQRIITNAVHWCGYDTKEQKGEMVTMENKEVRLDRAKLSTFWDHITEASEQSGKSLLEITKDLKAAGVDGIEMRLSHLLANEKEIAEILQEADLHISCFFEMYDWCLKPNYKEAIKQVDKAVEYGAKVILVVPGFLPEDLATEFRKLSTRKEIWEYMDTKQEIINLTTQLTELVKCAETKGITITLEDFDGFTAPFARIEELAYFMTHVPGLRYTLDMGNFAYSDEDAVTAHSVLQEYISHVHCKDRAAEPDHELFTYNKGLAPIPVGQGYIAIGDMQKKLLTSGYCGYMAIEHFGAPDQYKFMLESAKYLKDNMKW